MRNDAGSKPVFKIFQQFNGTTVFPWNLGAFPALRAGNRAIRSNTFCQAKACQNVFRFYPLRGQRRARFPALYFVFALLCLFSACSSAPKRPAEVVLAREAAAALLERANREADRGNYGAALSQAAEARRIAVSVDDPSLRVRTGLSMGNSLFFLGRRDEADAAWQDALAGAEAEGDAELAAVCRIYRARGDLLYRLAPAGGGAGDSDRAGIAEIRLRVQAELGSLKTDRLSAALGWIVIGLAEKELGRYREAEDALRKALAVHEKDLYLEQAAYDWYLIASVFSVAGRYADAAAALKEALQFDRRAENVYGLGKDWRAMGDVYSKAGSRDQAVSAYQRAAEIFRSGGFAAEAEAVGSME